MKKLIDKYLFGKKFYKVRARYKEEHLTEFVEKLSDDTILNQKPDGKEIVASMKRAKIIEPGVIEWYEMCYCPTPLHHERATVYDRYFSDLSTELVDGYGELEGDSFWSFLQSSSEK